MRKRKVVYPPAKTATKGASTAAAAADARAAAAASRTVSINLGAMTGRAEITKGTRARIASGLYQVSAGALAPALFTFNGQGTGDIAAIDATKSKALNKVIYLTKDTSIPNSASAAPGDVIEIFGTGFGETTPSYDLGVFADPQKDLTAEP